MGLERRCLLYFINISIKEFTRLIIKCRSCEIILAALITYAWGINRHFRFWIRVDLNNHLLRAGNLRTMAPFLIPYFLFLFLLPYFLFLLLISLPYSLSCSSFKGLIWKKFRAIPTYLLYRRYLPFSINV